MSDDRFILVAGLLLAAGLVASLLAGRLRLPGLVLFLGVGMLVGSEGPGNLEFTDYHLAELVGVIALALILFEGGLTAGYDEIRPVLWPSLSLALVGTLVTAGIAAGAAVLLFGLGTLEGLLLGSIVASTDGAAIFALLRGSSLRRRVARTLEGEAGFNDPVAVLLVLGFIDWIQRPGYGIADMLVLFGQQMAIGAAAGLGVGWLAVQAFQRARLDTQGLYPVASLAAGAIAYGGAASLDGSGFLAVYLVGLALGSAPIPAKRTIGSFHQGLAWVAQLTMFLTLGLLVFPSDLLDVAVKGTVLALVVAFVARPVASVVATAGFGFTCAERAVLGWAGLRGAVPVVLATFPVLADVPGSREFFNIVFFAVLLSTLLQGSTFEALARRLGVTANEAALPSPLAEMGALRRLGAEVIEFPVGAGDAIVGLRVRELVLSRGALVNVIVRGGRAIPPRGATQVEPGDRLHVLVRREGAREARELLDRWRSGPIQPRPKPSRRLVAHAPVFSVRPWRDSDGDPHRPSEVAGQAVIDRLRTRRDVPGALVLLEGWGFAVTGPSVAVGSRRALSEWARGRISYARSDEERVWWEELLGVLAL
ncbi:MAG: potassium/proton antiporter [Solirubrobacteraceae bacterium]